MEVYLHKPDNMRAVLLW